MSLLMLLESSSGGPNKFARFNGTTDYATIAGTVLSTDAGTLMIRCRLDAATPVLGKTGLVEMSSPGPDTHYPYTDGTAFITVFRVTRVDAITLSGTIDRTAWHWFIVRDDAGNGWEFLQGKDDGTLSSRATAAHQAFELVHDYDFIGRSAVGGLLDGDIDRFLWFPTRLGDASIQAVMAGGNGTGAIARFEFGTDSGGVFTDSSSARKNATITGSPVIEVA